MRVSRDQSRHDRRIGNVKTLHPAHAQAGINHRIGIAAKGKGMFDRSGNATFASADTPLDASANTATRKTVTASAEPVAQTAAAGSPGSMDFH